MDRILGTRSATCPTNLLETSINSETQGVDEFDEEEEEEQRATTPDEISETDENETADPVEHVRNCQQPEKKGPGKKKRNRSDMIQRALNDATETFINFQKEQERIYLDFEEKRMKMEADSERLREEREDRRLERADEQRQEDRERDRQHEFRLMSLFASHGNFVPQHQFSQQQFSPGHSGQSYQNL